MLTCDMRMVRIENEALVQADRSVFQQFVQMHETAVYTFCFRMVGNSRLAEAIAEKAFLDCYALFPTVTLADVLSAACRCCRQRLLCGKYEVETAVTDIQFLFNNLPIPEREALALRYGCKLNFDEIACVLGITCEAVRAALQQGRWRIARLEQTCRSVPLS